MKTTILYLLLFLTSGFCLYAQHLKLPANGEYFEWRKQTNKKALGFTGMKVAYYQKCDSTKDSLVKTGLLQINKMQFFDTCIYGRQQFVIVDSVWKETLVTFFDKKSADTYLAILRKKNETPIQRLESKHTSYVFWQTSVEGRNVMHTLIIKARKSFYYAYTPDQ